MKTLKDKLLYVTILILSLFGLYLYYIYPNRIFSEVLLIFCLITTILSIVFIAY